MDADPASSAVRAVAERIGDVRDHLVVLDFDGTLAPIVQRPDDAAMADGIEEAVRALASRTTVAVLTGRPVDDVAPRLGDLRVTIVGGHGTEVLDADGTRIALFDRSSAAATLRTVEAAVRELLDEDAGWGIEPKPTSIAVHHRQVDGAVVDRVLPAVRDLLLAHEGDPPGWLVLDGKAVTELRPRDVDKGTALRWLTDRHPGLRPLVIGDDVTDEDAFAEADRLGGLAVLVASRPRATAAHLRVASPAAVAELLALLAAAA